MRKALKLVLVFTLLMAGSANAAFVNAYDVANWTKNVNGGSINTAGAPNSLVLTSSNNGGGSKNQDFTIASAGNGIVSFAWGYKTNDRDGPQWDPFGWLLNGVFNQLTKDSGDKAQSGTVSFNVFAGDVFGFRANSRDSLFGSAKTTISGFSAPPPVPVPAAAWLIFAPLMGLMGRKRKTTG